MSKEFLSKFRKKATLKNPRTMVIYSYPKVGKTEMFTKLPGDYLILDIDGSAEYFDGNFVKIETLKDLEQLLKDMRENEVKLDFIVVDTITELDSKVVTQMAIKMYNKENNDAKPLNWDITTLEWGKGYAYKRRALLQIVEILKNYADTVILSGHVADNSLTDEAGLSNVKSLDVPGKLKNILALKVDAIALLYRSDTNENSLNFSAENGGLLDGSRSKHLRNKTIVISKLKDDETLETYWDKVFIKNKQ